MNAQKLFEQVKAGPSRDFGEAQAHIINEYIYDRRVAAEEVAKALKMLQKHYRSKP